MSGYHADNIAPAVMGGFILVRSYTPLTLVPLNYGAAGAGGSSFSWKKAPPGPLALSPSRPPPLPPLSPPRRVRPVEVVVRPRDPGLRGPDPRDARRPPQGDHDEAPRGELRRRGRDRRRGAHGRRGDARVGARERHHRGGCARAAYSRVRGRQGGGGAQCRFPSETDPGPLPFGNLRRRCLAAKPPTPLCQPLRPLRR